MDDILTSLDELHHKAEQGLQRLLVVLSGDRSWCVELIQFYIARNRCVDCLCVTDLAMAGCWTVPPEKVDACLGSECGTLVYDAFSGFYPAAFALTEGTLKAGGLCFLLAPSLDEWPLAVDSFGHQYAMIPYSAGQMSAWFITRLIRIINNDARISIIRQKQSVRIGCVPHTSHTGRQSNSDYCLTRDQQQAVSMMRHVASGHRNRPLVVLSNRGHGKSSAIGITCAGLLRGGSRHITITGPRKKATAMVFRQAANILGCEYVQDRYRIEHEGACIEFIAPDALLQRHTDTSIVFIDEAAALPLPLLESLLRKYHRLVFTSTVYGYEGNGRGFELRFFKSLDRLANDWSLLRMDEPIRWQRQDPLEDFCYQAFLFDTELADTDAIAPDQGCHLHEIECSGLADDETTLRQLYSLLMHAHYRTTPDDLRMILDAPYIRIFYLKTGSIIIGCTVVASEGGLDKDLAIDIRHGRRRVRGHMLPQSLLAEQVDVQSAAMRYARIMRIAVHPRLQGRGYGSLMLAQLRQLLSGQYDFVGASFAGDARLLDFWQQAGYTVLKLGHKKNAYSGYHSLIVLKTISGPAQACLTSWSEQFPARLLFQLTDSHRYADPALVYLLLRQLSPSQIGSVDDKDIAVITGFAQAHVMYTVAAVSLCKLTLAVIASNAMQLEDTERTILIQRLIQRRPARELIEEHSLVGESQLLDHLRELAGKMLAAFKPSQ